jgi:DNA-binding CsgD family transcriptional regulator/PAS domain-containing protein
MQAFSDGDTHRLIDQIYESAVRPEVWNDVIEKISELFGGSPVFGEFFVPNRSGDLLVNIGLDDEYRATYNEFWLKYIPWSPELDLLFTNRFGRLSDALPGIDLATNDFYLHWMEPQGLAPIWPVAITFTVESGQPVGGVIVFRRKGEAPFADEEIRAADVLAPHLTRSFRMRLALESARRARAPLAETLDRLPLGMLVLDESRQVLIENAKAAQILAMDDGLRIQPTGPAASDPDENARLRELLDQAMDSTKQDSVEATGFLQISRPSGKQAFSTLISPVLAGAEGSLSEKAAVAFFVSDPDAGQVPAAEALAEIYSLTPAESEVVQLLSRGLSLEEIASDRGISVNTTRSHLKHAFSKTGTSRQSELLGLVLSGVGSLVSEEHVPNE